MNASEFWKSTRLPALAWLVIALASSPTWAAQPMPAQQAYFHGFASLGYIDTTGNNFYGDTRHGGEVDYYEAGVNGFAQLLPNLSISGQILSRKAGATDDGKLRIDYAFLDYRVANQETSSFGARAGRVRNPLGFYNETRDVIFTRPSILLPQSAYFEGTGVRELLFASDGIQLYADRDRESSHTAFKLNIATDEKVSRQTQENLPSGIPGFNIATLKVKHPIFAQLLHEMDGGRERLAVSYGNADLAGSIEGFGTSEPIDSRIQLYILSGQYNAENWTLTSEYTLTASNTQAFGSTSHERSDGLYLQYQYRFTPEWTGLLRQDVFYPDRNDRSSAASRDSTVGISWAPRPAWLVSTEYHQISGTGGIPFADNAGMQLTPHTHLLAVMLGYRF
jgi:hypothetical protein